MSLLLVLQVLRRRLWIIGLTFVSTLVGAILILLLVPSRYEATATAGIDPSISDPIIGGAGGGALIMMTQGNLVALAKSNQVALAVVNRLNLASDPSSQEAFLSSPESGFIDIRQWLANQLADRVAASFYMGTNVMSLTYKASSPQQAATLANAFMSAFIDAAIAAKGAAAQKAASWYAPQIAKIRDDIAESRGKLAQFQTENKALIPSSGDTESDPLMAATSELTRARAELVALQNQYNAPAPTTAAASDPQSIDIQTINSLHASLSGIEADIARVQIEAGANNPRLLEKFALRQSLQKQSERALEDYRRKLTERIANQTERVATLQKVFDERLNYMIGIQGQRARMAALTRDLSFLQEELERVERAASQARLQSQLSFSNIAIIDSAVPPTAAAFPKKPIVFGLSIGLGLGLGVLLSLLAEALNRRVRSGDDIQFIANAPLLGVMPDIRPKQASRWSRLFGWFKLSNLRRFGRSKSDSALAGS